MEFKDRFPNLGFGVGLRRQHYATAIEHPAMADWFEVISENFMVGGGRPLEVLESIREHYPIVLHGVSMSLGSTDALNREYLRDLVRLARRFNPAWISDHLCWTGVGGHNLHELLPLPYTDEALRHVIKRIREVQDILGRPILIENVSSYLEYSISTFREWEFLASVAKEANCGILLDINNIYVNAFNHGFDAVRYIDAVPCDRVIQFHLAGHSDHGKYLLDTHDHPIKEQVWQLDDHAVRRFGLTATLIEWDDNIPDLGALTQVADQACDRARAALMRHRSGDAAQPEGSARPAQTADSCA
jgi:uncharacterized protein (UPF0276 family)